MKIVQAIIDLFGGIAKLHNNPIRIKVEGFMPLAIEHIGTGPRGMSLVSVMHYYEQHGDIMRDPDMEFEIAQDGTWYPISYRQDSQGIPMQEAVFRDAATGEVKTRPKLARDLKRFMKLWDQNLHDQGFLDKAREMTGNQPSDE